MNWSRLEADLLLEFEEIIGLKQAFARFFSEELEGVWLVKCFKKKQRNSIAELHGDLQNVGGISSFKCSQDED